MAFKVFIKPLTFFEIDEALFWYEKQLPGLGQRFLNELEKCIDQITQYPKRYLLIELPVRRILLKTFPYKLFYLIKDESEVVVIALIHTKRSNRFVRQRIKQ